MRPRHVAALIVTPILIGLAGLTIRPDSRPSPLAWPALAAPRPADLPDPRLTPGVLLPGVTRAQTCDPAWTHRSRNVPDSMKVAVFRAYGVEPTAANRGAYEVDHLCPVSLGGASLPANLWPQPWDGVWGAHAKDRLEAVLYRKVCKGEIALEQAQAVFLGDWRRGVPKYLPERARAGASLMAAPGPTPDDDGDPEGFPRP